jgi:hypothetical protein
MAILGLVSTETYDATRFKNIRRSVQYQYPNGTAVLTGLLSIMDGEETNDPQFSHWEKRHVTQTTLPIDNGLGGGVTAGPLTTSGGANFATGSNWTDGTSYRVYVADGSIFRVGHVIKYHAVSKDVIGVVSAVNTTGDDYITVRATGTVTSVTNNATTCIAAPSEVLIIGSAFNQGVVDLSSEIYNSPVEFSNYTQIFRTPFSFTGTALKTPLKFDESGPYQDKAKEHAVTHMEELEKAFLFGTKNKYVPAGDAAPTTGAGLPVTTTGGVIYHLQRWEAGDYRTVTATSDSDDDKRIITNSGGTMDEDTYDTYLERLFRYTNNTSNEKLVLCGSGFLKVINQMYRSKAVLMTDIPFKDTYGMNVVGHLTPFGTIYYKTHPLFTQNANLRFAALYLDVRNLRYRPLVGRDTTLLANRQPNDADYRKDEWFTETGLEVWFPESHMFIQNVTSYTP